MTAHRSCGNSTLQLSAEAPPGTRLSYSWARCEEGQQYLMYCSWEHAQHSRYESSSICARGLGRGHRVENCCMMSCCFFGARNVVKC